ncbi:MAG: hypothetical protein KatS3mg103_0896 [Phycisphaerales bacterium]|nr:MAG: hypothetical protein KatS3mg103_0896 [Phycisphaerales bacterium]
MASLRAREPARRATPLERLDGWLCRPGRVAALCVGLVAIALLAPLLAAQARVALLKGKIERAEALRSTFQAQARQAAIYRQLNERVWPMTKLMAEVAAAAPVHVVLDSVRLDSTGQIDLEGFVQIVPEGPGVQGPPESLVTRYESALNALGTLGPVTVVRREVVGDSVQFQVAAQVRNALARANLPMDYAQMPLAEVLYGPGARNDASPRPAALASGRGSPGRASAVRPGGSSPASAMASPASTASTVARDAGQRDQAIEGARQAAGQRRPTGDVPPASENGVPTPLTDEQIAAMDRQTAMREWSTRRSASRDASLDAETRARLAAEAEKLNAHFKALGSGG